MPGNLLAADLNFPTFTEGQSNEEKLEVVTNYLYMLMEQLRYTMANLGVGNFNDTELSELGTIITSPVYLQLQNQAGAILDLSATADNLSTRLESAEGDITSIDQYAKSITLSVNNGETSSTIELLAGGTQIASQIIQMDGLVTFTGLEDGTTVINGGCIQTGTIDAERLNLTGAITFTDLSSGVQNDLDEALTTANDAYNLAYGNQLPDYIHNTYIDSTEIRAPTIKANQFNVYPASEGNGGLSLYGIYNSTQYNMFRIRYYPATSPYVIIDSPAGAYVQWNVGRTEFNEVVDFTGATVTGLYMEFS